MASTHPSSLHTRAGKDPTDKCCVAVALSLIQASEADEVWRTHPLFDQIMSTGSFLFAWHVVFTCSCASYQIIITVHAELMGNSEM